MFKIFSCKLLMYKQCSEIISGILVNTVLKGRGTYFGLTLVLIGFVLLISKLCYQKHKFTIICLCFCMPNISVIYITSSDLIKFDNLISVLFRLFHLINPIEQLTFVWSPRQVFSFRFIFLNVWSIHVKSFQVALYCMTQIVRQCATILSSIMFLRFKPLV